MPNTSWICQTCGVQYPKASEQPDRCPICEDDRQWVPPNGQQWTTLDQLRNSSRNVWKEEEQGVWSVQTEPRFGIGQRAHLILTPEGNLLWDCISLTDTATLDKVRALGGIRAIAISHPHYYSSMLDWSKAFGNCPVHIHADDERWVVNHSSAVQFWTGETMPLFAGMRLIRCGGHFDGYQVLHHPTAAEGRGALFAGDQPQVCMDGKWVTFMYSYPNWIPFNGQTVRRITAALEPLEYDRLYGAFGRNLPSDAKNIVVRSRERYLKAIAG